MSGGGGSSAPATQTVNTSSIPTQFQGLANTLLGSQMMNQFNYQTNPDGTLATDAAGNYIPTSQKGYTSFGQMVPQTDANGQTLLDANGNPVMGPAGFGAQQMSAAQQAVAGFSPLQQQAQSEAANMQMPGQFRSASNLSTAGGLGNLSSANAAYGFGCAGMQSGAMGQNLGVQGGGFYGAQGSGYGAQGAALAGCALNAGNAGVGIGQKALVAQCQGSCISARSKCYAAQQAAAGANFAKQAQCAALIQSNMNPYLQDSLKAQMALMNQQYGQQQANQQAAATQSGAFGGGRCAVLSAQNTLNQNLANQKMIACGYNKAYCAATNYMLQGSQLGLQGLTGAQTGLNTALGGGQLGLQGVQTALTGNAQALQGACIANKAYQTGIQGALAGLQGVNTQLAGTAQGMQGAQVGLQGVQGAQAGYAGANQAASNLANIGSADQAAQLAIINQQNAVGSQQQAQQQNVLNQAIQNYGNTQNYPMTQATNIMNLLRNTPTNTTSTTYQAPPSALSAATGLGTAGLAAYQLTKKKGGKIKEPRYAGGGIVCLGIANALKGRK
jgi:hypothetical protein